MVVYFTSSGRTKTVAEAIAAELSNYEVTIEPITSTKSPLTIGKEKDRLLAGDLSDLSYDKSVFDWSPYDLVCIGVPVWGFRPALIFDAYIQKCEGLPGKKAVVFVTCRIYSASSLKRMKGAIEKKGGNVVNQKSFRAFSKISEKKAREFGKAINQ